MSKELGFDINYVEKKYFEENINKYADNLFKMLNKYQMEDDRSSLRINLKILMRNKYRMKNYILDYEGQINLKNKTSLT